MTIKEISLITNDINGTTTFYTTNLQLPILYQSVNRISFQAGASVLTYEQQTTTTQPVYHFAFNIPHNQLDAAINWLQQFTTLLPVPDNSYIANFESWNANAVYFYDNNGNLLELIARHDLKNDADLLSVSGISEIGIVTASVPEYADQIISMYKLPVFAKQPRMELFTALGDDNGLLIIAAKSRNWFPSQIPAQPFPARVTIENNGETNTLIL
jgi:catechol-2,3-dioxygenase